jgi:hypothetical protein
VATVDGEPVTDAETEPLGAATLMVAVEPANEVFPFQVPEGAAVLIVAGLPGVATFQLPEGADTAIVAGLPEMLTEVLPLGAAVVIVATEPLKVTDVEPEGAATLTVAGDPENVVLEDVPADRLMMVGLGTPRPRIAIGYSLSSARTASTRGRSPTLVP